MATKVQFPIDMDNPPFTQEQIDEKRKENPVLAKRWEYANRTWECKRAKLLKDLSNGILPPPPPDPVSMVEAHLNRVAKFEEKKTPGYRRSYKIPTVLLVQMLQAGFKQSDIARLLRVNRGTISRIIKDRNINPKVLQAWRDHKVDVLSAKEIELIEAMNKEKIDKATLRDCATSFKLLHEAGRHEKGLGTGTEININVTTATLEDLDRQERELKAKLIELSGGKLGAPEDAEIVPEIVPENDTIEGE